MDKGSLSTLTQYGYVILKPKKCLISLMHDCKVAWLEFLNSTDIQNFLFNPSTHFGYIPSLNEYQTLQHIGVSSDCINPHKEIDYFNFNYKSLDYLVPQRDLNQFIFSCFHWYPWSTAVNPLFTLIRELYAGFQEVALAFIDDLSQLQLYPNGATHQLLDIKKTELRMLSYQAKIEANTGLILAEPHTDINLFTIIPLNSGPGLELFIDNQFKPIHSDDNQVAILAGEMLNTLSNNKIPPAVHRVFTGGTENNEPIQYRRTSFPFFVHPCADLALLENVTAGKYYQSRMRDFNVI